MGDRVLTQIPEALKKLIKYVMRGFYRIEEAIIMDLLIHHPCIKEDDLADLIQFDQKQLRLFMNALKQEHFIKARMRVETDSEGRTTRHNYYYISYNVFINVVKYKLLSMRKKIETDERQTMRRPSFLCPNCQSAYTDLDVGRLMSATGQLVCAYCQTEVEEDTCDAPQPCSETLMTRFNCQMEPIYKLLQELDDINLAPEVLEPEPRDIKTSRSCGGNVRAADAEKWSGDTTKNIGFTYVNAVKIAIEGNSLNTSAIKPREAPIWLKESTIEGGIRPELSVSTNPSNIDTLMERTVDPSDADDIMKTLLDHETKSTSASSNDSEDSDFETFQKPSVSHKVEGEYMNESDDDDDDDDDEELETNWIVEVSGNRIPFKDISEEILETMTTAEKEEYIRIGQEIYQEKYG